MPRKSRRTGTNRQLFQTCFFYDKYIYISIFSFLSSYGLDIHIFNRFIPFHLYHKVSISFRGIIIAVSRRGTQAPTDNGKRSGIITTYVKEEDQFKKGKGRGLRIGTLQATKRLIDSSYEALFLSIYCLSSSKQSFVTKKKAACYRQGSKSRSAGLLAYKLDSCALSSTA